MFRIKNWRFDVQDSGCGLDSRFGLDSIELVVVFKLLLL